jgi:hypothetical protein
LWVSVKIHPPAWCKYISLNRKTGKKPVPENYFLTMPPEASRTECNMSHKEADAIQRFFSRPVFLSLTIGIPFCIFKLLFGLGALRIGIEGDNNLRIFGTVIIVWATADLLMNIGRSLSDLAHKEPRFEYCTIAQLGRVFGKSLLFLAIDTLITFSIICAMLWLGWITRLTRPELLLWYTATTLNLISLSIVALYNELRNK